MREAVVVSTARTPLAKSWRGAFNMTHGATLGGAAVRAAVATGENLTGVDQFRPLFDAGAPDVVQLHQGSSSGREIDARRLVCGFHLVDVADAH